MKRLICFLLLFYLNITATCQKPTYCLEHSKGSKIDFKVSSIRSIWLSDSLLAVRDDIDFFQAPFEKEIKKNYQNLSLESGIINSYFLDNYTIHGVLLEEGGRPVLYPLYSVKSHGDAFGEVVQFRVEDLTAITVKSRLKPWMKTGVLMGLTSMLIISPLVAYDFRAKNMRSEQYNQMIKWSFIGMTTCFTINIFLKDKTYRLYPLVEGDEYWRICYK